MFCVHYRKRAQRKCFWSRKFLFVGAKWQRKNHAHLKFDICCVSCLFCGFVLICQVCSVSRRKRKIMTDQMSVPPADAWARGLTCIRRVEAVLPKCAHTVCATACTRLQLPAWSSLLLSVHSSLDLWVYLLLWALYAVTAVRSPRSSARLPYWDAWVARVGATSIHLHHLFFATSIRGVRCLFF